MRPSARFPLHLLLSVSVALPLVGCGGSNREKPPIVEVAAGPMDRNASPEQLGSGDTAGRDEQAPEHNRFSLFGRDPDRDADGLVDNVDQCPNEPEDRDGFQDEDGCPEPDNDADGILDRVDLCPNDPETINGIEDEDGCPDTSLDRAKRAFREGVSLFSQGDYVKGCKLFEEAYKLEPRDNVLFNMAVCSEKLNNRPLACQYYNRWRSTPSGAASPNRVPSLETCP